MTVPSHSRPAVPSHKLRSKRGQKHGHGHRIELLGSFMRSLMTQADWWLAECNSILILRSCGSDVASIHAWQLSMTGRCLCCWTRESAWTEYWPKWWNILARRIRLSVNRTVTWKVSKRPLQLSIRIYCQDRVSEDTSKLCLHRSTGITMPMSCFEKCPPTVAPTARAEVECARMRARVVLRWPNQSLLQAVRGAKRKSVTRRFIIDGSDRQRGGDRRAWIDCGFRFRFQLF